jgi:hypothetical protein
MAVGRARPNRSGRRRWRIQCFIFRANANFLLSCRGLGPRTTWLPFFLGVGAAGPLRRRGPALRARSFGAPSEGGGPNGPCVGAPSFGVGAPQARGRRSRGSHARGAGARQQSWGAAPPPGGRPPMVGALVARGVGLGHLEHKFFK